MIVTHFFSLQAWNALVIVALSAPAIGLVLSVLIWRRPVGSRAKAVYLFYFVSLPLAALVMGGSDSRGFFCAFLLLLPVGIVMGLTNALVPPAISTGGTDGLCPTCGYDLRATPNRCPECGAVPANTQSI
jgi:hypothetical protein